MQDLTPFSVTPFSSGVNLRDIQQILGHHSILTTTRYTHLTTHSSESAIERINTLMSAMTIDWGTVK